MNFSGKTLKYVMAGFDFIRATVYYSQSTGALHYSEGKGLSVVLKLG